MVSPAAGEDELNGLLIHPEFSSEHGKEFLCLLFHSRQHLVIGTTHNMVCIEVEDQVCPAPALFCHGPGIRFLVICRRIIDVLGHEIFYELEEFILT